MAFDASFPRETAIGASEAAAILGLSPYQTAWEVWARKTGELPPEPENARMRAGNALEPLIGQLYSERTGEAIVSCPSTFRHPGYAMVAATPDWMVSGQPKLVEGKAVISPNSMREYGEDGSGVFPDRHAVQAMCQMAVVNCDETAIAALVGGELRVYRVARDKPSEEQLLDTLAQWWERHMVKGEPPPIDASDGAKAWLKRKFPRNEGRMLPADPKTAAWVGEYKAAATSAKEYALKSEVARNILCHLIADADGIEAPGIGKVTWKLTKDSRSVDWERIARLIAKEANLPAFLERCIEECVTIKPGSRRFLFTEE